MQSAYYQNHGQDSRGGTMGRTLMACVECRKKKKKCEGCIPCQRCSKKALRCVKIPVGRESYDSSPPVPPVNTYLPRVELPHQYDVNPHPYQDPTQISGMTSQYLQVNGQRGLHYSAPADLPQQGLLSSDTTYTVDADDQYYLSPAQQATPHLEFSPQQPAAPVSYLYTHSGASQYAQDPCEDAPNISYTPSANHQYIDGAGEISDSNINNMWMQGLGQDGYQNGITPVMRSA